MFKSAMDYNPLDSFVVIVGLGVTLGVLVSLVSCLWETCVSVFEVSKKYIARCLVVSLMTAVVFALLVAIFAAVAYSESRNEFMVFARNCLFKSASWKIVFSAVKGGLPALPALPTLAELMDTIRTVENPWK